MQLGEFGLQNHLADVLKDLQPHGAIAAFAAIPVHAAESQDCMRQKPHPAIQPD